MKVQPINNITFTSQIKKLYKKGRIKVKYGLYGEELTKQNVSDEHIICKCFGGTNDLSNIALASKELNNARGNNPIEQFVTMGMIRQYLFQFKGIKCQGFDGDSYIRNIKETFKRLMDDD